MVDYLLMMMGSDMREEVSGYQTKVDE